MQRKSIYDNKCLNINTNDKIYKMHILMDFAKKNESTENGEFFLFAKAEKDTNETDREKKM